MPDRISPWKWIGGVLGTLFTVVILYVASSITTLSTQFAVMQTDISHLRTEVRDGTKDRYTGTQSLADLALRDQRIETLKSGIGIITLHLERLSNRVTTLETKHNR